MYNTESTITKQKIKTNQKGFFPNSKIIEKTCLFTIFDKKKYRKINYNNDDINLLSFFSPKQVYITTDKQEFLSA